MRGVASRLRWLVLFLPVAAWAQLDPVKRDLVQIGYNQPLEGQAPVAAYAFYYHNDPEFLHTNYTLRLAVAPTYLDSEFGLQHFFGPQTDLAFGLAGGGFAYGYNDIQNGTWIKSQSFDGNGGGMSSSVSHLFNPTQQIPLFWVLRGEARYVAYAKSDNTAPDFQLPADGWDCTVRTGLRWGGIEPTLFPELAMEMSVWYEGQFRTGSGGYGYNDDRQVNPNSQLFWGSAALSYTLPESRQNFFARVVAGTSVNVDRLSAYRLGGFLPLVAEYPLSLPGYYFQEFSAQDFALVNAAYVLPIAPSRRWNLIFGGATAYVNYAPGTAQQQGNWVSGLGAGLLYRSPADRFKAYLAYGHGVDAIRSSGRGANNLCLLLQINLGKIHSPEIQSPDPGRWRGWNWIMGR